MISVFTPTYNRAYILPALYQSLQRQTCRCFEWIIVDDGSTDNTGELIASWQKDHNDFAIIYRKQHNGGKHTAINYGVTLASYKWFFIVDSDDYLRDDAIEKICSWTREKLSQNIAAVSGTRCFKNLETIGGQTKFKGDYCDCRNNERGKYGLLGDKAEVYRTDILKKYPFPVFKGEKFLSECAVWDKIALEGYKIRWYDYPLMVCEYLEDGLSAKVSGNDLEMKNFQGYIFITKQRMALYTGIERLRYLCAYSTTAKKKGFNAKESAEILGISANRIRISLLINRAKPLIKKLIKR